MDFQFVFGNPRRGGKESVAKKSNQSDHKKKGSHPVKKKKKLKPAALRALRLKNLAKARKVRAAKFAPNPHSKKKKVRKTKKRNPYQKYTKTGKSGRVLTRWSPKYKTPEGMAKLGTQIGRLEQLIKNAEKTGGMTKTLRKIKKQVKAKRKGARLSGATRDRVRALSAKMVKAGWTSTQVGDDERTKMAKRKRKSKKSTRKTSKKRKTHKRKSSPRRKKRTKKVKMATRKIRYPAKMKRRSRYTSKWGKGSRKRIFSVRRNPGLASVSKVAQQYLGHSGMEAGSLLAGGAIYGAVNAFVLKTPALAKIVGQVNSTLNMIPGVGTAVTQVVGPAIPNLVLGVALNVLGDKMKQKAASEIGKGIIGASLAAMGANLVDAVTSRTMSGVPTLRGKRGMRGIPTLRGHMRGVDYTPGLNGVDYTPGLNGVDYTPGMGQYKQSNADFGRSADFGRDADFGAVPTLRGAHDHDADAGYDREDDTSEDNETSSHLG